MAAQRESPSADRLRVAVLGAGAWARTAHLPGFARDERCQVVGIADPNLELAHTAAREFAARELG